MRDEELEARMRAYEVSLDMRIPPSSSVDRGMPATQGKANGSADGSGRPVSQNLSEKRSWVYSLESILLLYASPGQSKMIRCHLSTLMGRDKLRIADVSRRTGLNRSTITALYKETTTRVDLPAVDQLCRLFNCQVGDLFEYVQDGREVNP